MQAAGNQLFTGAAVSPMMSTGLSSGARCETCSSTSRKLFASPSKLSLYSAMMKFATC